MTILRAALLGGVDGTITAFAIVAGAAGGELGVAAVGVLGLSNVLADGLSMGVSEYLSADAEARAGGDAAAGAALRSALACFGAFVATGLVPVGLFVLARSLLACAFFTLAQLLLLGAARARATGEPLLRGVAQTGLLGAAAGGVAYGVAAAVG
jgi:VIT1/CCC1 family predicted Fe2+/Mn2+ transporter